MISLDNICIQTGDFCLQDVSFSIPESAYAVLMGKTGSGKTTILECIIGLRPVSSGTILIGGKDVTRLNPALRGIGYVPQDGALFSRMTVRDHLAYALTIRRASRKEIADRVEELATLLGITHLLHRTPPGLSGGESQRVSLGRALSFRPKVLCLDEPLSALDRETREQMCELLGNVRQQTRVTTIQVTHNPEETQMLADCVYRLEDGKVMLEKTSSQ
ncbi:ATP-binding cassette domain-containing protein [Planctomycetaceae bacterium]|jgi:molybdate/tungstate transport system ATP-binding protein|nr:ATP-binding cassette domain-containing protein [Planctomycetaceae bacterium]MDC0273853.1 ATP-binding cassette domain-containing protein [Planctomycetaceae bacterium]MDG2390407.1 ATP-binding cassette domain-containing protein [Planctomycetaceae bacterium]